MHEECGVVGLYNIKEAANYAYLSLYALQHRGQEGSGIVSRRNKEFFVQKGLGLVNDVFKQERLKSLPGAYAVGHNRYATHGPKHQLSSVQPFLTHTQFGQMAISHNGNFTNADSLRKELTRRGSVFSSTSDTEVFVHLFARRKEKDFTERLKMTFAQLRGAYSMLIQSEDTLYAARDPKGFRPLVFGKKDDGYMLASETCALELSEAEYLRDIEPGELLKISQKTLTSISLRAAKERQHFCSFEPIYFARPDSKIAKQDIYSLRKKIGAELAKESPVDNADLVIAIPDSGTPLAMGYAGASNLPFEMGLIRNHYVGRTFIEPEQSIRDFGVKLKLSPVVSTLKGKNVVVLDDSIVRGTTSKKIVRLLKKAQVKSLHMRIGSPPMLASCYYGVDTPISSELIASQKKVDEIRDHIGADSLAYLSLVGLKKALQSEQVSYCYACFTADYPEAIS